MALKIGILTYHRSYNYGAFMQCYSLATRIQQDFPNCKVEVIDYLSKEVSQNYHNTIKNQLSLIVNADSYVKIKRYTKSLIVYCINRFKGGSLKNANTHYFEEAVSMLPLSPMPIVTDNLIEISNFINDNYDIVIVGSDAVWNFQMRPFPNVYFLGKTINVKKLSYAASSYGQQYKELPKKIMQTIRESWQSYHYVGVRDLSTENFVKYADSNITPFHNCDPTVFLDMDLLSSYKKSVMSKLLRLGFDPHRKTIGLMASPRLAAKVKENLGAEYQIVSIFKSNKYADVNLMDVNPFEWAVCFSFFDVTITHYFHGNLLSLKNGTPTLVIEQSNEYNRTYNSKIRDFMMRINMIDYCYFDEDFDYSNMSQKVNEVSKIDKTLIGNNLKSESLNYNSFKNALMELININF